MDLTNLEKALEKEPPFRLKQAKKAVFQDLIEDWKEAMVLPLALRKKLSEVVPLKIEAETLVSGDKNTVKTLIGLNDGLKVESVLMNYPGGRNTVCVSSQVGCPLGCVFCATGKLGFKRNLESFEIVEQVLFFARYLKKLGERATNIVFMGMGEPFLNYDNVLGAIRVLNDKDYFNIGARRISISTVGIVKGIERLAKESLQVNLAISLHAPNEELRSKIMPINKKYPLVEVLRAVEDYLKATRRKIMFEYIMINQVVKTRNGRQGRPSSRDDKFEFLLPGKGVNDSVEQAKELAGLLSRFPRNLFMVNLISYNPTGIFKASSPEQIKDFKAVLEKSKIEATQRYRFGQGIKAACGQLAAASRR